ncbi:MAG TPA: EAL domain-containing protein [Gemmatimonadaceae bacterium]|nr:EAL domain-containing protein [Gemmatimonadaceae bacterium]
MALAASTLTIAYSVAYLAWRASGDIGSFYGGLITRLAFLPLNAATAILAWRAAMREGRDPRIARALRFISAAFFCVFAGNVVSFYIGAIDGGDPGNSWINILYFPFYPLILFGLFSFPFARRGEHEYRKLLLDAAAVLTGGGFAIWYLVLRPTMLAEHLSPLGSAIALAYPLGALLIMVGLTTYILRRPPEARGGSRTLLIGGLATYALCDLANDLLFLEAGWFGLKWTDVAYLAAYCFLISGLAAFRWPDDARTVDDEKLHSAQPFSPIPYAVLALVYGLLLTVDVQHWPEPLAVLSGGVMAVTLLVVIRQIAAVRENARLLRERSFREGEERFKSLVRHSSDVIAIVDVAGTIKFVSPSVTRIFGYQPHELMGTLLADLLHPEHVAGAMTMLAATSESEPGATTPVEWRFRHREGRWLHVETVCNNLLTEPTVQGIVLNTRDIGERKALEEQLTHQAFHDPLTGLANRALFLDRVSHALSLMTRHRQTLAVLFVDLDGFKNINDSLGHAAGDALLAVIARRLLTCVRAADTVARLGGDEFAFLIEDATDENSAAAVAERVAEAVRQPIELEGKEVVITSSIGIATADLNGNAADLLRDADMAMYVAKGRGKARYERFEPGMQARALERLELQGDLRRAAEHYREFRILYQPIVLLRSGELVGVEALLRWDHPRRGTLSPADFIPMAEETGVIMSIGSWVLRQACREARRWRDEALGGRSLSLTVNVSGLQLQHDRMVDDVREALEESGMEPADLVLEITESVLMSEDGLLVDRLSALKELGVRLAIDDFGTGYSSLGYLQRFPIDILKIDKAFIDEVGHEDIEPALVRAIIALGGSLRLQTIAEGVELQQQSRGLQELGCEMGQGYFFGKPASAAEIDSMLDETRGGARFPGDGAGAIH